MERKLLIIATLFLWTLAAGFLAVFLLYPQIHEVALNIQKDRYSSRGQTESVVYLTRENIDLGGHNLRLELPTNVSMEDINIEKDYINKMLNITIPGVDEGYFNDFPIIGSSNRISEITYMNTNQVGNVDIKLDNAYEMLVTLEDRFVYLDFEKPKNIYDYIVVVDAGHGGKDAGAISKSTYEKDINLEMLKALKEQFDKSDLNIGVFYTRLSDKAVALDSRVGLANDLNADLFISIHQNSTASGRLSKINGTEVMYKSSDNSGGSKEFSQKCLTKLLASLESTSKGLVAGDEIFIIREAKMPVALAEVGFITNSDELKKLKSKDYQKKAMKALYEAVVEQLTEG